MPELAPCQHKVFFFSFFFSIIKKGQIFLFLEAVYSHRFFFFFFAIAFLWKSLFLQPWSSVKKSTMTAQGLSELVLQEGGKKYLSVKCISIVFKAGGRGTESLPVHKR